jgi:CheY-like chemotaxis protein
MRISKVATLKASGRAQNQYETVSSPRILVVDDNHDTRQLCVNLLVDFGYEVEAAADGAAGWEAIQINHYDLIVTDNKMPKMTGIEMLKKIRSTHKLVPVIMATGDLPTQVFRRKPWLQPDASLQRPFSLGDLLATIKKVLRRDDSYNAHLKMLLPANS